jgi:hypothetical protein
VVNVILRQDLRQGALNLSYGDFTGGIRAPTLRGSFSTGTREGKTSLSIIADWFRREEFLFGEFPQPVKRQLLLASNTPGSFLAPIGGTDPITGQTIAAGTANAARTFTVDRAAPGPNATFTRQLQTQNTFDANAAIRPQSEAERRGVVITARHGENPSQSNRSSTMLPAARAARGGAIGAANTCGQTRSRESGRFAASQRRSTSFTAPATTPLATGL